MVSVYEEKKVKIDFILTIYLIFIALINAFIALGGFAFTTGIALDSSGQSYGGGIGISLADLATQDPGIQLFSELLFVLLIVLVFLDVFYYSNIKKNNLFAVRPIQIITAVVYFLLIADFGILFSNGTSSTDYATIRVYGTGVFGISGFFSFLILGILQIYWIIKSVNSLQPNNLQKTYPAGSNPPEPYPPRLYSTRPYQSRPNPPRPSGMDFIIIYQIIIGGLLILVAIGISILSSICISFGNSSCNSNPNSGLQFAMFLLVLWALLGIISAIFLSKWNYYGYIGSWIFLISTGLLLSVAYLVPTICTIVSLVYFRTNKQFKETLNFINSQKDSSQNVSQVN